MDLFSLFHLPVLELVLVDFGLECAVLGLLLLLDLL